MRAMIVFGLLLTLAACKTDYQDDKRTRMRHTEPDCYHMYGGGEPCSGLPIPDSQDPANVDHWHKKDRKITPQ